MREGLVIVPQRDSNGKSLQHVRHYAELALSKAFGGVTVSSARGSWVSTSGANRGELITEPVWQLVAAYEPSPANDAKLDSVARYVGHEGKQQAVYVRHASGEVSILNTEPERLAA